MKINVVTVVGANGVMGRNVSAIFASFGNAKVYMVCRSMERAKKAAEKAASSVRADSISSNLIPCDFSMLEKCVEESDLIFESVTEDMTTKKQITSRIAAAARANAILCTGTSGLSIQTLSESIPDGLKPNYFGVHMFNPPYNMVLCELIKTNYSDDSMLLQLKKYLNETLFRTVVEVKDTPAFLANRIGFQLINEALQYAEKYKDNGGIDYIDSVLGKYTGRSMPPIMTADFVGLDIHAAIVKNLHENTDDYANGTFVVPGFVNKLIKDGKLGRKSGEGFYKTEKAEDGSKSVFVYDISTSSYRRKMNYVFPYAEKMIEDFCVGDYKAAFSSLIYNESIEAKMCIKFMLKYIIYSIKTASEVGFDIHSADDVMATGFNWCPPLAMADALSTVIDFKELINKNFDKNEIDQFKIYEIISKLEPSKYDFRPYFKSAK